MEDERFRQPEEEEKQAEERRIKKELEEKRWVEFEERKKRDEEERKRMEIERERLERSRSLESKDIKITDWKYSELKDCINSSKYEGSTEEAREEFHRRLKAYQAWKSINLNRKKKEPAKGANSSPSYNSYKSNVMSRNELSREVGRWVWERLRTGL